jgi:hypothetical protein
MKLHSIVYDGHAPGAVRDAFLDAVDHMSEMGVIGLKLILLCRQLRNCTDPLPGVTCQMLGIPAGSTYGCGAAALLERREQLSETSR